MRAAHHYARPGWSLEQNRAAFGAVADSHAHDYRITVTLRGPIDPEGFIVDLVALDRLLAAYVRALDGTDLNEAIPEVRAGCSSPRRKRSRAGSSIAWRRVCPVARGW